MNADQTEPRQNLPPPRWLDPLGVLAPAAVEHAFNALRQRDPRGHRAHVIAAMLFLALVPAPMSVVEFAGIPLAIVTLLRLRPAIPGWRTLFLQPIVLIAVAWTAWQAITLAWSPDPRQGLDELSSMRFVWVIFALWPVMDHRRLLIVALAAGFAAAVAAQALHVVGASAGIDWLDWDRAEDRYSGWWQPVVAGTLLTGALGLQLPAALGERGRSRAVAVAGVGLALLGVGLTGSRGAWIASALLLVVVVMAWGIAGRSRRGRAMSGRAAVKLGLALAVVAIAAGLLGPGLVRRAQQGIAEVTAAVERGDFASDTGARILMARAAIDAARSHPLLGVGAGGFRGAMADHVRRTGAEIPDWRIHDHAHNAVLHVLATSGAIGLLIAVAGAAVVGVAAVTRARRAMDLGPACALAGLVLVSAFDVVHVNAQTSALLWCLVTMCMVSRPREAPGTPLAERRAMPNEDSGLHGRVDV